MVLIRCPTYSKQYVMYREHPSSIMEEIDFHNVNFLEMSSQALVKSKRISNCMSYSKTFNHLSMRKRIWNALPSIDSRNVNFLEMSSKKLLDMCEEAYIKRVLECV